jgi:hypothetical protein
MRMDTFIRRAIGLKAHRVVKIGEDDTAAAVIVHLDRREHRRLHCGECGRAGRATNAAASRCSYVGDRCQGEQPRSRADASGRYASGAVSDPGVRR